MLGLKLSHQKRPRYCYQGKKLEDRRFIDQRPKKANNRLRVGDLEADFIVSGKDGQGILLVAVCRKTRVSFLELISTVSIDEVHRAFAKILRQFPEMKTLTLDNDVLFRMHRTLETLLEVKIYFCHAYHSWEKGSVENTNKEIRKFIPKGSDLSRYDQDYIELIKNHLNDRFMACLKYATPAEAIKKHRQRTKKQRQRADKQNH